MMKDDSTRNQVTRRTMIKTVGAVAAGLTLDRGPWGNILSAAPGQPNATTADLIVRRTQPFAAETPLDQLVKSWVTPNELFFVHHHANVPKIDADSYQLSVEGLVDTPMKFTLHQLMNDFRSRTMPATIACAGNRRDEFNRYKPTEGVAFGAGAVGNAKWTGTLLADVLDAAGVKDEAKYVWLDGLDQVPIKGGPSPFGASLPREKVYPDSWDQPTVLLAYKMNGQPLSPAHGFPLRVVVPGFVGARSVKWLGRIVASDRPSSNHFVTHSFKIVKADEERQWAGAPPLYKFPLNSAICVPAAGARLREGKVTVQGYAMASGATDRRLAHVDVSPDRGRTWFDGAMTQDQSLYCWRLWSAEVPVTSQRLSLIVRAVDSVGVEQPKRARWNLGGYAQNSWHEVPILVD